MLRFNLERREKREERKEEREKHVWRDFNWPCLNFDVRCTTSRVLRAGEESKGNGREEGERGGEETRASQERKADG